MKRLLRRIQNTRPVTRLIVAICFATVVQVGTSGLFLLHSSQARQENCDNTFDALSAGFAVAFDKLGHKLGAGQSEIDDFIDDLIPALEPIQSQCS